MPLFERAIGIRDRLAQKYPEVYTPVLAMTVNDVAAHYQRYGLYEDGLKWCQTAESLMRSLWDANPGMHGDTIARVMGLKAKLWLQTQRPTNQACAFLREGMTMAIEPGLRRTIQSVIQQFCEESAPPGPQRPSPE
ncbi:hypothetical protein DYQ86_04430 [Acidobacteria bacterium AB60]|nr:hypothetical protein DYQ86_04430 [Acidobacteria bacterium AB60]